MFCVQHHRQEYNPSYDVRQEISSDLKEKMETDAENLFLG